MTALSRSGILVSSLNLALVAALGALSGLLLGALGMWLLARRWRRDAHEAGRGSRDAEIVALASQRDALAVRGTEAARRIEAFEQAAHVAQGELRKLSEQSAAHKTQAERFAQDLADARRARDQAQGDLVELTRRHASLEAGTREQAKAATEKLKLLEDAEQRLREAFQNLAGSILEDRAQRFGEQSEKQVGGLLEPLKLQLKEFREAFTQTHANEQRERGMLASEIQSLKQLNQRIGEDALNLTRALKGDTRAQGAWGELVLERVLEASGLQVGREYTAQASFNDGQGGRQRPDVIVHLPDDKDVVIDSKVSLLAWERSVASADEAGRALALGEHVASLRRHIDGLSGKDYRGLAGLRTLDFVLMFVPVEAAFIEAVRVDERLYLHALERNVCLVSPSTLLATLRTVAHLWRIERRNAKADEIARRAAQLHDNFVLLVEDLAAIGGQLEKAQTSHAGALRRLTQGGKGSVVLQIQTLSEIAAVKKELPSRLLDEAGAAEGEEGDAAGVQDLP